MATSDILGEQAADRAALGAASGAMDSAGYGR